MNENPIDELQDARAPFPHGVSFGLQDELFAENPIKRALGSRSVNVIPEYPEDAPRPASWPARTIAFQTIVTGNLQVTMTLGPIYFKGIWITCPTWPAGGIVDVTTYPCGWITVENAVPTFGQGAIFPEGTDTAEVFPIFFATIVSSKITEVLECQHGSIRAGLL